MKTLKLIVITSIMVFALSSTSVFANEPSAASPNKYQKDNALIGDDIAAIHLHKEQIKQLKAKSNTDRNAGHEQALIMDKRVLAKKKADLKRSEAYLAADKKDLKSDYRLSFRNYRDEIKNDQANLDKSRNKLDQAINKGNEGAIAAAASKISYYQTKLKNDRASLNNEENGLDSDLASIDEAMNKGVQPVAQPNSETAYAGTNGKMYK